MYERITRQEFKDKMDYIIAVTKQHTLYAIDMVYPLLESGQDSESLPYLVGNGSLMDTLFILHNNIDIRLKDNLIPDDNDLVYFIDANGMPSKTDAEQYKILKGRNTKKDVEEEVPYVDVPDNLDNANMFG